MYVVSEINNSSSISNNYNYNYWNNEIIDYAKVITKEEIKQYNKIIPTYKNEYKMNKHNNNRQENKQHYLQNYKSQQPIPSKQNYQKNSFSQSNKKCLENMEWRSKQYEPTTKRVRLGFFNRPKLDNLFKQNKENKTYNESLS
jgi:hypothetical protein